MCDHYLFEKTIATEVKNDKKLNPESIANLIADKALQRYQEKYISIKENLSHLERQVMLQILDVHWKDHLAEMDHLRQSVGLRAYAQKNPKNEYKREAFEMFEVMLDQINSESIKVLFRLELATEEEIQELENRSRDALQNKEMLLQQEKPEPVIGNDNALDSIEQKNVETVKTNVPKFGRNEMVKITDGENVKELKYKKAIPLIENEGWRII